MLHRAFLLVLVLLVGAALGACGEEPEGADRADDAASTGAEQAHEDLDGQEENPTDAADGGAGNPGDTEAGTGLRVAAPVYPLAWVAEQVAPGADVTLLTLQGQDPHDLELGAHDRELLETADVVAYMGDLDYQPQLEQAVAGTDARVVSLAAVVGRDRLLRWDDEHGHDDERGGLDPHAWFDAGFMAEVVTEVGEAFAEVDPDHAPVYRGHAAALADQLADLDEDIDALLGAGCAHDRMIVSHEAYAYLVEPHGLAQEGVSGVGGHGEASPQRIAQLVEQVQEEGIEHVLTEPTEGRQDAEAVAAEAGVELLEVSSLEVVDDEGAAGAGFVELLREQAETAAKAMGCD